MTLANRLYLLIFPTILSVACKPMPTEDSELENLNQLRTGDEVGFALNCGTPANLVTTKALLANAVSSETSAMDKESVFAALSSIDQNQLRFFVNDLGGTIHVVNELPASCSSQRQASSPSCFVLGTDEKDQTS